MAIKYKGEVEFQDSTGQTFVLRLGQFQIVDNQKVLDQLKGQAHQTQVFLIALRAGAESQKAFTTEDASEIIDDIGYTRLDELLRQTKFYHNVNEAADVKKAEEKAATLRATALLMASIEKMRDGADPAKTEVIDALEQDISRLQKEGSANPPETTTTSN